MIIQPVQFTGLDPYEFFSKRTFNFQLKHYKGLLRNWLLDVTPELNEPETLISTATQQRQKLPAVSMGKVKLRLYTILRNFEKYGVET